jgi:hypothetical protein
VSSGSKPRPDGTQKMKLKLAIFLSLLILCPVLCAAQKAKLSPAEEKLRIKLAKQSAVDNFEVEIEAVQFSEVRGFIYYQLAAWLWKDGKDDTGYALRSAVKALEVSLADDGECSDTCLRSLALLEKHAPETKKRLVEKYKLDSSTELGVAGFSEGPNSDRVIADKLIAYMASGSELNLEAGMMLQELADKNSELPRVLEVMLSAAEQGRTNFSADNLFSVADALRSHVVPESLRLRFYSLAVRKAVAALGSDDGDERNSAYNLIDAISEDVPRSNEGLFNQVGLLKSSLTPEYLGEDDEEEKQIFERIEKSNDKLAATIAEADATGNKKLKTNLSMEAFGLALEAKKAAIALDVLEKLVELSKTESKSEEEKMEKVIFARWCEQSYGDVAELALKVNDLKINERAIAGLIDKLSRSQALKKRANYLFDKGKLAPAAETIRDAAKSASEAEFRVRKILTLLQLIPATQKIVKDQVFNVTLAAVKALESFPRPEAKDDNGQAEKKYAAAVAELDLTLYLALGDLLKKNRSAAIDMSNRIERKEFKIAAGLAMLTDELGRLDNEKIK